MDNKILTEFLITAKKNTYANSSVEKIVSSRVGSFDYHYEATLANKKMIYHDTFFGGTKFMGEEVVYCDNDKPLWGMNYYGVTLDSTYSEEAMDNALRPALIKVGEDASVLPVRGPHNSQNGEYTYTFKSEGTLENFIGEEEIYKNNKLIYKLHCHGGFIE
ncbi:MAG: XRE family transcriptional regulator [Bacilli bacterium]|nr:XRE family transcriptional regulator [Bacilli bacterium]